MFGIRTPLPLVAALVIITLAISVLIGTRAFTRLDIQEPIPAGPSKLQQLAALEARPLRLPTLNRTDACPDNPGANTLGHDYGSGPVYADSGSETDIRWGWYYTIPYYADEGVKGLVLIRGRDLRSDKRLTFFSEYGAGPVTGPQVVNGQPERSEVVLDVDNPASRSRPGNVNEWVIDQGMARPWDGCFGIQIDGPNFTEIFTGYVPPAGA
jgi:hypothetical protein